MVLSSSSATGEVGYDVSGELGPELDSNATRTASDAEQELRAGLLRIVGQGTLKLRGGRHRLQLTYGGGAKVFFGGEARSADEAVQRAQARWGMVAGRRSLWLLGSFYDAYQRTSRQDFRTGSAVGRLMLASARGSIATFDLGYQGLEFKPFDDYSFHGLTGGLSLSTRVAPKHREEELSWRLGASYALTQRFYNGQVLGAQRRDPCVEDVGSPSCGQLRRDLGHRLRLWATYSGNAEATLWYAVEVNGSNSFGETFTRHAVGIKFTTLLGLGVFLTTKGIVRLSRFRDPFLVLSASQSRFVDIDDENRSTLLIRLGRDLGRYVGLTARYTLHVNESTGGDLAGASAGFLRHLVFLGVSLRLNSTDDD